LFLKLSVTAPVLYTNTTQHVIMSLLLLLLLTTCKAAWLIISVDSVCLSVRHTITFESLNVGSPYLHIRYISRQYGSSSYVKVIRSRSRSHEHGIEGRKFLFPQCKLRSPRTPVPEKIEPSGLRVSWGFRVWRIQWCDRHFCHVTGNDHAFLNACICRP